MFIFHLLKNLGKNGKADAIMFKRKTSFALAIIIMLTSTNIPAYADDGISDGPDSSFVDTLNEMVTEYAISDTEIVVDTNNETVYTSDGDVTTLSKEIGISKGKEAQIVGDSSKLESLFEDYGYVTDEEGGVVTATYEYASGRLYVNSAQVDETYGAVLTASGDYTVLQYETPEAAKEAGEKIESDGYDVMPSFVVALEDDGEDDVVLPESIGGEYIDGGTDLHGLKDMVESGSYCKSNVTVAVIDTGINDYFSREIARYNFSTSESDLDTSGHGTKVASVIADSTSDNVSFVAMKVFDDNNNSDIATIETALLKCMELDIDVVNISVGIFDKNFEKKVGTLGYLDEEFTALKSMGVVTCVSAGNESRHTDYVYPAGSSYVWTVTAIDVYGNVADFSNFGKIDFSAKGVSVVCINASGQKVSTSGTSFATPYVTAMAANYKGMSDYEPDEIYDIIRLECVDLGETGKDEIYGYGCISYEGSAKDFVSCKHEDTKTSVLLPTCTSEGYSAVICKSCGEVLSKTVTPKKNHKYSVIESRESTCISDGYDLYRCTSCKAEYKAAKDPDKDNHENVIDKIVKEATCTENGIVKKYCISCGEFIDGEEEIAAIGHDFVTEVLSEGTCTNKGKSQKVCRTCNYTEIYETGINEDVHLETKEATHDATCTEDGYVDTICVSCGKVLNSKTLPKTGHSYKEISRSDSSCTESGWILYECEKCKDTYKEEIAGKTHIYSVTSRYEGTCSKKGIVKYTCDACGESYEEETGYTDVHTETVSITAATCEKDGCENFFCKECGKVLSEKTIKKLGHVEATMGKITKCVVCGQVLNIGDCVVTYDADGGSSEAVSRNYKYNSMIILPAAHKSGYNFAGWSDGENIYAQGSYYKVTGNLVLKAKWESGSSYTLTIKSAGRVVNTINAGVGSNITLPEQKKRGYTFSGWYIDGKKIETTFKYTYNCNKTIIAKWTKTKISAPQIAETGENYIKICPVVGAVKYQVMVADNGSFKTKKLYTANSSVINTSLITEGTWIAVRSVTKDSTGNYVYSKWAKKKV